MRQKIYFLKSMNDKPKIQELQRTSRRIHLKCRQSCWKQRQKILQVAGGENHIEINKSKNTFLIRNHVSQKTMEQQLKNTGGGGVCVCVQGMGVGRVSTYNQWKYLSKIVVSRGKKKAEKYSVLAKLHYKKKVKWSPSSRNMIPHRNLDLHKEINSTRNGKI